MKDKLSFATRKLKGALKPITTRVRDVPGAEKLTVYGVSNQEGVTLTGKVASEDVSNYIVVGPNQFVYNPYRVNVGSIGLTGADFAGIVSPAYVVFETGPEIISGLLFRYLKSSIGQKLIRWYGDRGGVRSAMRFPDLVNIDYPAISPEEQQAALVAFEVVAKAESELQQEFDHQATLLTRLRQAVLREAVQGRLVPQDATDEPAPALLARIRAEKQRLVKAKQLRADKPLPPLPETEVPYEVPPGWAWCRLGELVSKMDSGWSPACLNTPAQPGSWGVLKTTAVQEMEYRAFENKALPSSLKPKAQYEVEAGDILITRAGPYQRVGVICLVESSPEKLMISDKIIRFHCADGLIHPQYIALCIQTGAAKSFLDSKKFGMAESQVNISQDNLRLTPITLPPLPEQRRIVAKVTELLAHCTALEAELGRARQAAGALHAAALREAFTRSSDLAELV